MHEQYNYSGGQLCEEIDMWSEVWAWYVWGTQGLTDIVARVLGIITLDDWDILYFHVTDIHGSLVTRLDATGQVVNRYVYDAYGAPKALSANWLTWSDVTDDMPLWMGMYFYHEPGEYGSGPAWFDSETEKALGVSGGKDSTTPGQALAATGGMGLSLVSALLGQATDCACICSIYIKCRRVGGDAWYNITPNIHCFIEYNDNCPNAAGRPRWGRRETFSLLVWTDPRDGENYGLKCRNSPIDQDAIVLAQQRCRACTVVGCDRRNPRSTYSRLQRADEEWQEVTYDITLRNSNTYADHLWKKVCGDTYQTAVGEGATGLECKGWGGRSERRPDASVWDRMKTCSGS